MADIINRHVEVAGFEIREDDDGHHLVGIVAPFGALYDAGAYLERFAPTAFDKTIRERGTRVALLEQHATDRMPIGRAMTWEKTNDGLIYCLPREQELISVVAHAFIHHELDSLMPLIDLGLLMSDPDLDWDFVVAWCRNRRLTLKRLIPISLEISSWVLCSS